MKLSKSKIRKIILESILKEMGPAFPVETLEDAQHFEHRGLDVFEGFAMMAKQNFGNVNLPKLIMKC